MLQTQQEKGSQGPNPIESFSTSRWSYGRWACISTCNLEFCAATCTFSEHLMNRQCHAFVTGLSTGDVLIATGRCALAELQKGSSLY